MIARLQQFWTLSLIAGLAWWCWRVWPQSPAWALAGLAWAGLCHALVIGTQFVCMHRINREDAAPRARWPALLRAWWAEAGAMLVVFCWRQPFRSASCPDWLPATPTGRRGVVLVHGFLCNRGVWLPWMAPLRAGGHAFVAVNLEPVFGSIDDYVPALESAVQRVQAATGAPPVLICHSMGGLAARAWLRACAGDARVHRVVTLGTPHRGTWAGRFSRAANGRQMALDGDWVGQLRGAEPAARAALFTCWYSNCDNIVFPTSTAALPGADHRWLPSVAHVEMARRPEVLAECLELLARAGVDKAEKFK